MHEPTLLLMIFGIALFTSLIGKFVKLPEPIIGVVVGLFFGLVHIPFLEHAEDFITQPKVIMDLVMVLFLPALLGKETFHLPLSHLNENKKPISVLAVGGSLVTFLLIGFSMHYIGGFSVSFAFTFAALMCATDPITVASIFKTMGINKRLSSIIEGESLFNDGVAVVLFRIASVSLLAYMEKGATGVLLGLIEFVKVVSFGAIIGAVLGFAASWLVSKYDDVPKETAITIFLFFSSFLVAEAFHVSGVIAVVVAGLILGNIGKKHGMSPSTRLGVTAFWDIIASIANSLIFLIVGLEINRIDFSGKWTMIILSVLIVLVSRALSVYSSLAFVKGIPMKWKHLINWGGLKGSLSLVLALSLPENFVMREEMIVLTFSTVLFSILFQGMTVGPLIKWLGLQEHQEGIEEYESVQLKIQMELTALNELENQMNQSYVSVDVYEEEKARFEQNIELYQKELRSLYETYPEIKEEQQRDLYRSIYFAQYDRMKELQKKDIVTNEEVLEKQREKITEKIDSIKPVGH